MTGRKKLMKSIRVCGDLDDKIHGEILSRLPVKSLVRFKCVSKGWQSMISKDNYFIDLHLSRSKRRSSPSTIFMVMLYTDGDSTVVCVDLFNEVVPVIRSITQLNKHEQVLRPVNGLICSYYYSYLGPIAFRIVNVMTREETPWIFASIKERIPSRPYSETLAYGFGLDITTKEHKVICIWETRVKAPGGEASRSDDIICKVMTAGRQNYTAWRTIDDFPPYIIEGGGIFVNTSLYWLSRNAIPTSHHMNNKLSPPGEHRRIQDNFIIVFHVTSEKFRSIPIPNFIVDQPDRSTAHLDCLKGFGHPFEHSYVRILEVEGHIALADQVTSQIVKLWIFDEDGDSHEEISTTVSSGDGSWTEETILMPFGPLDAQPYMFESITGTKQLVIGVPMPEGATTSYTLFLYNRKSKNFMRVEISGMPRNIFYSSDRMTNFAESLLPVPKKQKQ